MSQTIILDLHINRDDYQRYYQGQVKTVLATALDGRRIQFPAGVLQRVVTHDGVHGRFAITFTAEGRFEKIERLR